VLRNDRGQALVEFALIALVFYFLVAGFVDIGRMIFTAQALQDAARVAAREFALTPLPASSTFEQALQDPGVLERVFDPKLLVIDLDAHPSGDPLNAYLATLPLVNQALRPLMIVDHSNGKNLLRYPGALLSDPSTPSGFTVGIPSVTTRGADGVETIAWIPVIEEARPGSFSLGAGLATGVVALRINFPFQAALLSGFQGNSAVTLAPNIDNVIVANDAGVSAPATAPGGLLPDSDPGLYAGKYGLGRQLAFGGKEVRPYRKLLAGEAIFRREVMQ
jgi:TadE-like protein